jgi:hypothetical protein
MAAERTQPEPVGVPDKYKPVTIKMMKLLFDAGRPLSIDEVASVLLIHFSAVQYYFDLLIQHDLIVQTNAGFESSWTERNFPDLYVLTSRGRKYFLESEAT